MIDPLVNRIVARLPSWTGAFLFYERGGLVSYEGARVARDVGVLAGLLRARGLQPGARVGIRGENGYAWVVRNLACLACGLSTVGLDADTEAVVSELGLAHAFDLRPDGDRSSSWEADLQAGAAPVAPIVPHAFGPDDAVAVKFTSGSTGKLRALDLRRRSVDDSLTHVQRMFAHGPGDKLLVFLPLQIVQQRFWVYSAVLFDHDTLVVPYRLALAALQREKPTVIMGVPEFFENLIKGFDVESEAEQERFRALLGGRARYLWTGSAPIARATLEAYARAGVPLLQGYGMNETCIVSKNYPGHDRLGSVGKVLPGKTVVLDPDGQIFVRSDNPVSDRYLNVPADESAATFRPDGFVATGDVGYLDDDGYLYITGRMKDLIVLSNGKNVAPTPIEKRLESAPAVERAVVFGSGRSFLTALLAVPAHDVTRAELERVVAEVNATAPEHERIRRFTVTREHLTRENGLLTSQFKVRRKAVWETYGGAILDLYADPRPAEQTKTEGVMPCKTT